MAGSLPPLICIQSHTSSINQTQMANFIQQTLVSMGATYVWDGTANWKVDL